MTSIDVHHLCEAVIVVKEVTALSVQNVPYIADFHCICNMTVYT